MKRKQILLTAVMAIAVAFAMTACKKMNQRKPRPEHST